GRSTRELAGASQGQPEARPSADGACSAEHAGRLPVVPAHCRGSDRYSRLATRPVQIATGFVFECLSLLSGNTVAAAGIQISTSPGLDSWESGVDVRGFASRAAGPHATTAHA